MKDSKGLTAEEAEKRLSEFGPNEIFRPAKISFFKIASHEVTEPMILLLLVVGFFYSIWGKLDDAITIFAVILLLVLAEVYNEFRAKKAIASLERIATPKTKVLRGGRVEETGSEEVVPGDILILTPGTKIAADAGVQKALGLQVDESALTGESFPQEKKEGEEIYAGTLVVAGEGQAEVSATGGDTRLGRTAATLKAIKPPKTALQLAMKSLAGKLVYLAVFFSVLIPVVGILRGQDLKKMILTGLALSFAVIPEELPIVITMVLGLGAYTLSKNRFLVKKIKAAEILGNATVIVTDKTGTITESRMRIVSVYPGDEREVLRKACCALSSYSLSPLDEEIDSRTREMQVAGSCREIVRERNFDNGRKSRSVMRKTVDRYELFMSGAPEEIFAHCRGLDDDAKNALKRETSKGRRVIGVASRGISPDEKDLDFERLETGLDFSGLIGFEDPPREGVAETVKKIAEAGIRTIMVTGDHPLTAGFIAQQVGILTDGSNVVSGKDLDGMTGERLRELVKSASVFARTTAEHKYRIVKALQANGEIVAVTGDGVNDVLALKAADIGVAMGIRGTDVARDTADVVLADDNYVTITNGVFEGRKFFDNLQKGLKYYLSVKFALVLIFLLPALLGSHMPFAPIQIILLELFMDLAASAGYVSEPKEKDIYSRPPRDPKESIMDARVVRDIAVRGVVLFASVMAVYFYTSFRKFSLVESQTFTFSAWLFGHIVLALVSRSEKQSIFSLGLFTNRIITIWAFAAVAFLVLAVYLPFLNVRFSLAAVNPVSLALVALVTVCTVGSLELRKAFARGSAAGT
ncbi:MAG: cation-transporting P-type ATPase [Nitrospirae bacterium]|nr:cation-transporting P-type ATPase [Nitrospirota bacterium]